MRAAQEIVAELERVGLDVRCGLHTGEVELDDDGISGVAVHIGARVAAAAEAGEIVITRTVKDLTAGSGLVYRERGVHELRGIPGQWELFNVVSSASDGP